MMTIAALVALWSVNQSINRSIWLCVDSPSVQAGGGTIRVEQAAERQVHRSYDPPVLEHGAEHQGVGPQAL